MAEHHPLARSPIDPGPSTQVLDGWEVRRADGAGSRQHLGTRHTGSGSLTLTDCTPLTKVLVRAGPFGPVTDVLAVPLGRAARRDWDLGAGAVPVLLVGSRPGQWLALAPPDHGPALAERLQTMTGGLPELVTVVDLTHARALLRLTGSRVRALLAKECGADLRADHLPDGSALGTVVAGVSADIVRDDVHAADRTRPSFLLLCEWMTGQYLVSSLLDAGQELGLEQMGFQLPGM